MHATNALCIVDDELRAKMLGDAIPAESFAAGRNEISGVAGNYNYQGENATPNGWPKVDDSDTPIWEHSDLRKVAYYYVHKLIGKFVKESQDSGR